MLPSSRLALVSSFLFRATMLHRGGCSLKIFKAPIKSRERLLKGFRKG